MVINKVSSLLFLLVSCVIYARVEQPPMPMPGFGGFDPNMTEEQLINKLMEEINEALPEEQREAFWQEVAQETERLEKETAHMAPEEKEKYLLNLIAAETGAEPMPAPTPVEPPVPTKEEVKITKPKIEESLEKSDDIIALIKQIVRLIESFITKSNAFPDFDGKVAGWRSKGRITDWQADSWSAFQHDITKFVHILQRFNEKDIKIGFKHIDELAKQKVALQHLKHLYSKLQDYEPTIKITPFEIANMSEQTKNASINVINALTDALYRSNIPQELQKIVELFDPMAKKLREEEEKAAKTASVKKFETQIPVRTAGRAPTHKDDFVLPSFDALGFTGKQPEAISRPTTGQGTLPGSKEESKGGPTGGASAGSKGKAEEKPKGDEKKSTELPTIKKDEKKESAQIKHPEAKKNIEDLFRKDIEDARNTIEETPEFLNGESLKQYLLPPVPATPATK